MESNPRNSIVKTNNKQNLLPAMFLGALGALLTAPAFAADNPAFPVKVNEAVYPPPEYRYPKAKIGVTYKDSTPRAIASN